MVGLGYGSHSLVVCSNRSFWLSENLPMKASLFRSLWHLHLITPRGIMRLVACFWHEGITLMAVLRFAAYYHASECAVVSEGSA